jgi:transposase-like protein
MPPAPVDALAADRCAACERRPRISATANPLQEPDHRGAQRVTRPRLGCKSCDAAQGMLAGIKLIHMIQKRQRVVKAGEEDRTAAEQFYALAA